MQLSLKNVQKPFSMPLVHVVIVLYMMFGVFLLWNVFMHVFLLFIFLTALYCMLQNVIHSYNLAELGINL